MTTGTSAPTMHNSSTAPTRSRCIRKSRKKTYTYTYIQEGYILSKNGPNSLIRSQKTAEMPVSFCPLVQPKWKCDNVEPLRDRLTYNQ